MTPIVILVLIFFILGALDYLFGSRFKIGKEFEKGFNLLGTMVLSMVGMVVISPLIASFLSPVFDFVYNVFKIDPSIIPAMLFSNDMGGAFLAVDIAKNTEIGNFNALVVSSMMGATVSFTIPLSVKMVDKRHIKELAIGLLSGIVTIPFGAFISGLICNIKPIILLFNLLPLIALAIIIALLLVFVPNVAVNIFKALAFAIRILAVMGLVLGAINFLAKSEVVTGLGSFEEGAMICVNASLVMGGMFPLLYLISKLLKKPFNYLGKKLKMNNTSMMGFISTLATDVTTFGMMNEMDEKGMVLNSAFTVSAAFTFAGCLAFTLAFNASYLLPVIVGKLIAGALAIVLASLFYLLVFKKDNLKTA